MKEDESKLWNAVIKEWNKVKDYPEGTGDRLVMAWNLGKALGIPVKRIEYLTSKWDRQKKWCKLGSMTGTDIVTF